MGEKVKDAVPEILMKIQAEISAFRGSVEARLDTIEAISRKQRRDSAGMLVMMRATAGNFEERIADVEERMAVLEKSGLRG
ncbi:MAG: hypothetical protein ACRC56_01215 [Bosea sp. (in: a-proteobacteria)]